MSRKIKLTQVSINSILYDPAIGREDYYDADLPGFRLRVGKTSMAYAVYYRTKDTGRQRQVKIGSTTSLTAKQARAIAQEMLAQVALGEDPARPAPAEGLTLGDFLEEHFFPKAHETMKSAAKTEKSMRVSFANLWDTPIEDITLKMVDDLRSSWRKRGNKGTIINRKVANLRGALSWGARQEILAANPLAKLSRRPEKDSTPKLRYLTIEEEDRLYKTLHSRDEALRKARQNHIAWHIERGITPPPPILEIYADHLEPLITVSLKTGIRRGALFGLEWRDVDFEHRVLVIRGEICKTGKGRVVPLSETALETIRKWKEQSQGEGLIFPSPKTGKRMDNVDSSWERVLREANIKGFRWHDLRHTFASRLVVKGIDLNVVRELLGHSDLKMTLRYAHLAPNIKSQAVELLG